MISVGDAYIEINERIGQDTDILGMNQTYNAIWPLWPGITQTVGKRHNGRLNVTFCDGHVEAPPVKILFSRKNANSLARWNVDQLPHAELLQSGLF